MSTSRLLLSLALLGALVARVAAPARAADDAILLPTGMRITPTAAPGATFVRLATHLRADGNADATDASALALSPDGRRLLVLTSGYNLKFKTPAGAPIEHRPIDPATGLEDPAAKPHDKAEWVFVYDVSTGAPRELQQLAIPNTFDGIAWRADGTGFYVSGGIDDRIYAYVASARDPGLYAAAPAYVLGHDDDDARSVPAYDGGFLKSSAAARAEKTLATGAVTAQVAASRDGRTLYAANLENDSLSIVDAATRAVREIPFAVRGDRRGHGEYPYGLAVLPGPGTSAKTIFVSSLRDDEIVAVHPGASPAFATIPACAAPSALALSPDAATLYAACGNADALAVIDTRTETLTRTISLARPGDRYRGANPNALAVAPDGARAYVSLGGENAVAVVDLAEGRVAGRIPTGWYPTGVALSPDGTRLFVCNEKSDPGPNPDNGYGTPAGKARNPTFQNQYGWALEKAGLLTLPVPDAATLATLSAVVDRNVGYANRAAAASLDFMRGKIRHVLYITNENRTYDQVLGDLPGADGDPALTLFPQPLSPNHHAFARDFVTLDAFFDPGESSGVGWNWSVAGHTNDYVERAQAVLYGNAEFAGLTYDYQGIDRNLNLALPQSGGSTIFDERLTGVLDPTGDSSMLPGPRDVGANAGDGDLDPGATGGYLWDEALRHGLTVRNYGEHIDLDHYDPDAPHMIPVSRTPFAAHVLQAAPAKLALAARTDPYYRGFDQNVPDQFRVEEWLREFDGFVARGDLPNLEVMTVPHDHFGDFKTARMGLTTPERQFADNDFALARIVSAISHSRYWSDTAIFIDEDDSQSGSDHVSTHRAPAFVISPYVKRGFVDHTRYTTDSLLRTIEVLLGLDPLGMNDANAAPMTALFTAKPDLRPYAPIVPGVLCGPDVSPELLGATCTDRRLERTAALPELRDGSWWAAMTGDMDFRRPDAVDAARFDAILWYGVAGTFAPTS